MPKAPPIIKESGVYITIDEAESLLDFIELNFINSIREDPDCDSMEYVANVGSIYKKLRSVIFAKYDEEIGVTE